MTIELLLFLFYSVVNILFVGNCATLEFNNHTCQDNFQNFVRNESTTNVLLIYHNAVRHNYNVAGLNYSLSLEAAAEQTACQCEVQDLPATNTKVDYNNDNAALAALAFWIDGHTEYDNETMACRTNCMACSDFMKVVNYKANSFGCAVANCSKNESQVGPPLSYMAVVCVYDQPIPPLCLQISSCEYAMHCTHCCPYYPFSPIPITFQPDNSSTAMPTTKSTTTTSTSTSTTTTTTAPHTAITINPNADNALAKLAHDLINALNVERYAEMLMNLITEIYLKLHITEANVYYASLIMDHITDLKNVPKLSVFNNLLKTTNILLNANETVLQHNNSDSTQRIIESLNTLVTILDLPIDARTGQARINYEGENIAMDILRLDCSKSVNSDYQIGLVLKQDGTYYRPTAKSGVHDTNASVLIYLNKNDLCGDQSSANYDSLNSSGNGSGISAVQPILQYAFRITNSTSFFPSKTITNAACGASLTPNSQVPSASLFEDNVKLSKGATMSFVNIRGLNASLLHKAMRCGYWDSNQSTWSAHGCRGLKGDGDELHACTCNHMTDFALLVDTQDKDALVCDQVLEKTTIITSALSLVSLVLLAISTVLSLCKTRQSSFAQAAYNGPEAPQLLMLYATTFAFFFFWLLFSNQRTVGLNDDACVGAAAFLHFLVLSMTTFGTARGFHFFRNYFLILRQTGSVFNFKYFGVISAMLAWGISAIIVGISFGSNKNLYNRSDGFCWIRPDLILYALIAPMSVFLLLNCIIFAIVWANILKKTEISTSKSKKSLKPEASGSNASDQQWGQYVGLMIGMLLLMGIPWILSYFTNIAPGTNVFHYLFSIMNGLQGVWLLLLLMYQEYLRYRRKKYNEKINEIYSATQTTRLSRSGPLPDINGNSVKRENAFRQRSLRQQSSFRDGSLRENLFRERSLREISFRERSLRENSLHGISRNKKRNRSSQKAHMFDK